jgi:hypothetical protein
VRVNPPVVANEMTDTEGAPCVKLTNKVASALVTTTLYRLLTDATVRSLDEFLAEAAPPAHGDRDDRTAREARLRADIDRLIECGLLQVEIFQDRIP